MKDLFQISFLPEPPSVSKYLAHPGVNQLLQAQKNGKNYAYPIELQLHQLLRSPKYAELKIARRVQNIGKTLGTRYVKSVFYSTPLLQASRFTSFLTKGFGFLRETADTYELHNATGHRAVTPRGYEAGYFSITRPSFSGDNQYVITYYFGDYKNRGLIKELFQELQTFEATVIETKQVALSV